LISSAGKYYPALDHVRAVAAYLVFSWHFIHVNDGHHATPPLFPLSLLTEGHTGVSLFMTLSGYLFAKLLDGKQINYAGFLWNRILRLVPLIALIAGGLALQDLLASASPGAWLQGLVSGTPGVAVPSGAWSIFVEFNFYLLLPLLLFLSARSHRALVWVLAATLALRMLLHTINGEVHWLAYWTIVGRIDQFVLGMLAFQYRHLVTSQHLRVLGLCLLCLLYFHYFDSLGGFYELGGYPSTSPLWIWLPTVEGFGYALITCWYDTSFRHADNRCSRLLALIGTCSYSIYLLHFYVVFEAAALIDRHLIDLSNIYLALLLAFPCFLLMVPLAYLSYRFVEMPFLKLRVPYMSARRRHQPAPYA